MPRVPGELSIPDIDPGSTPYISPVRAGIVSIGNAADALIRFDQVQRAETARTSFDTAVADLSEEVSNYVTEVEADPNRRNLVGEFEMRVGARAGQLADGLNSVDRSVKNTFEIRARTVLAETRNKLRLLDHQRGREAAVPALARTFEAIASRSTKIGTDPAAIRQEIFEAAAASAATGRFAQQEALGYLKKGLELVAETRVMDKLSKQRNQEVVQGIDAGEFNDLQPQRKILHRENAVSGMQRLRYTELQNQIETWPDASGQQVADELANEGIDALQAEGLRGQSAAINRARSMARHSRLLESNPAAAETYLGNVYGSLTPEQRELAEARAFSAGASDLASSVRRRALRDPVGAVNFLKQQVDAGKISERDADTVFVTLENERLSQSADQVESDILSFQESRQNDPSGVGDYSILQGRTLSEMSTVIDEMVQDFDLRQSDANQLRRSILASTSQSNEDLEIIAIADSVERGARLNWNTTKHRKAGELVFQRRRKTAAAEGRAWSLDDDLRIATQTGYISNETIDQLAIAANSSDTRAAAVAVDQFRRLEGQAPNSNIGDQFESRGKKFAYEMLRHAASARYGPVGTGPKAQWDVALQEGRRKAGLDSRNPEVAASRRAEMVQMGLLEPNEKEREDNVFPDRDPQLWWREFRDVIGDDSIDWKAVGAGFAPQTLNALLDTTDYLDSSEGFKSLGDTQGDIEAAKFRGEVRRSMQMHMRQTGDRYMSARQTAIDLIGNGRFGVDYDGAGDPVFRQWPLSWKGDMTFTYERTVPYQQWSAEAKMEAVGGLVAMIEKVHGGRLPAPSEPGRWEQFEAFRKSEDGANFFYKNARAAIWATLDFGDPDVRNAVQDTLDIVSGAAILAATGAPPVKVPSLGKRWAEIANPMQPRIEFFPHSVTPADGERRYQEPKLWDDLAKAWKPIPYSVRTEVRNGVAVQIPINEPPRIELTPEMSDTYRRRNVKDFRRRRVATSAGRGAFLPHVPMSDRIIETRDPGVKALLKRDPEFRTAWLSQLMPKGGVGHAPPSFIEAQMNAYRAELEAELAK